MATDTGLLVDSFSPAQSQDLVAVLSPETIRLGRFTEKHLHLMLRLWAPALLLTTTVTSIFKLLNSLNFYFLHCMAPIISHSIYEGIKRAHPGESNVSFAPPCPRSQVPSTDDFLGPAGTPVYSAFLELLSFVKMLPKHDILPTPQQNFSCKGLPPESSTPESYCIPSLLQVPSWVDLFGNDICKENLSPAMKGVDTKVLGATKRKRRRKKETSIMVDEKSLYYRKVDLCWNGST